jgi:hypothetical protein
MLICFLSRMQGDLYGLNSEREIASNLHIARLVVVTALLKSQFDRDLSSEYLQMLTIYVSRSIPASRDFASILS